MKAVTERSIPSRLRALRRVEQPGRADALQFGPLAQANFRKLYAADVVLPDVILEAPAVQVAARLSHPECQRLRQRPEDLDGSLPRCGDQILDSYLGWRRMIDRDGVRNATPLVANSATGTLTLFRSQLRQLARRAGGSDDQ